MLAGCAADDVVGSRSDAAIHVDLGTDGGGGPASLCVVVCQYYGPGEYRAECRAIGGSLPCEVAAYPICDTSALPNGFDAGVYPAPMCLRSGAGEARVAACAIDADGLPVLTEPPVVRCVAVE